MDCGTSADLIARSLSGNASAEDEAQLRGHLAGCPACAGLERRLAATWALMGRLPSLPSRATAPAPAAIRILALRRRPLWTVGAAAAALFVVAAVAFSLRTPRASEPAPAPIVQQSAAAGAPPSERKETAAAPEPPAPPVEKAPAPIVPPAPAPSPDEKTVAAPELPPAKPATPEAPQPKDPVARTPALPETRPETKPVPPPVAPPPPAALPIVATVARIEGDVFSGIGASRAAVKAGQKLTSADAVETSAKGQAELVFDDGTRVVLEGDSLADGFQAEGGKRLTLKRGQLKAKIARQPAGEPMIFVTATAEARVLGTRLSLLVTPTSTRLEVREGKVRITRKDDNSSADVSADHFVVAGKGLSMTPKPLPVRIALHETFDLPRWGGGWLQGGDTNVGIRLATENGSLSVKTLQRPAQELSGGKMPSETAEMARKALQGVNNVANLSRKDWPRSAWLETRQSFAFSNESPMRVRVRGWNSHHDPDRIVWIALNHGVAGQGLSLERRGDSLQLWIEGAASPVWKKDIAGAQEWETIELWLSKDQVLVRRNEELLYSGANPLKVKAASLSLGTNAKMELAQDEEARFDDVDVFLTTKTELDEVAR
jgi:ferric-dicitrate binding protein FerR (iron transport regulator)